jgi:uncharacterized protein (DUF305 family)
MSVEIRSLRAKIFLSCSLFVVVFLASPVFGQDGPVIVRPGAPGEATKVLPAGTRSSLPPVSPKDVEFMQGMIMHHAQAVEMTALINDRTDNEKLRLLGSRISQSQSSEMNFMKRWLTARGRSTEMEMGDMSGMDMSDHSGHHMDHKKMEHHMMMPGMLTPEQMKALEAAKGDEFDRLFLEGMIQHHTGALIMVKDLFDSAGAGQDAELFNFATDVDSGQRAEIRIMQSMLGIEP